MDAQVSIEIALLESGLWNLTFSMAYSASMTIAGLKIKYVLRGLSTELLDPTIIIRTLISSFTEK